MELNEGTHRDREDTLDLSVWNLVSLCVVSSAPELRIVGLLGEGGFGIVIGTSFKGQDCALKCEIGSAKKLFYNVSLWRENEYWRQRERSFPFLISCFESILYQKFAAGYVSATPDKNVHFLSMQRLATRADQVLKKSLDAMRGDDRVGQEQTRNFAKKFIGAVYVANQNCRVVHRDLKPGNVMVTKDGGVVIVDWGQVQKADGLNYDSSKKQHIQRPGKVQVQAPENEQDQNRVYPALKTFPGSVKTAEKLGSGTPGYYRGFTPEQDVSCEQQFKAEVSNRDMYGAAMTLLHAVIPKLKPVKFSDELSKLAAVDFDNFLDLVRRFIPPGTLNTYIDGKNCRELLYTIFKLIQSNIVEALHSPFLMDPIFTETDEKRLRDGIVVQRNGRKPIVLMYVDGCGLLVFLICPYMPGETVDEYAGRIVDRAPKYDGNSPKCNTTDEPQMFSGHIVPIPTQDKLLIGDITLVTPLDTYLEHGVMSFAQSSRINPGVICPGNLNLVGHVRSPLTRITLNDGTLFGKINMTARVAEDGIRPATWCYDWSLSFHSDIYSHDQVAIRQAAAARELPEQVMARLVFLRDKYAR